MSRYTALAAAAAYNNDDDAVEDEVIGAEWSMEHAQNNSAPVDDLHYSCIRRGPCRPLLTSRQIQQSPKFVDSETHMDV